MQGGARVQDASYIYQELGDKFNWTVRCSATPPTHHLHCTIGTASTPPCCCMSG